MRRITAMSRHRDHLPGVASSMHFYGVREVPAIPLRDRGLSGCDLPNRPFVKVAFTKCHLAPNGTSESKSSSSQGVPYTQVASDLARGSAVACDLARSLTSGLARARDLDRHVDTAFGRHGLDFAFATTTQAGTGPGPGTESPLALRCEPRPRTLSKHPGGLMR